MSTWCAYGQAEVERTALIVSTFFLRQDRSQLVIDFDFPQFCELSGIWSASRSRSVATL